MLNPVFGCSILISPFEQFFIFIIGSLCRFPPRNNQLNTLPSCSTLILLFLLIQLLRQMLDLLLTSHCQILQLFCGLPFQFLHLGFGGLDFAGVGEAMFHRHGWHEALFAIVFLKKVVEHADVVS